MQALYDHVPFPRRLRRYFGLAFRMIGDFGATIWHVGRQVGQHGSGDQLIDPENAMGHSGIAAQLDRKHGSAWA